MTLLNLCVIKYYDILFILLYIICVRICFNPPGLSDAYICFCKLNEAIIDSDKGLVPVQHWAIIWTRADLLSIEPLRTNVNEIGVKLKQFSFKKMKLFCVKLRPSCLGHSVLRKWIVVAEWFDQCFLPVLPYNKHVFEKNYFFLSRHIHGILW